MTFDSPSNRQPSDDEWEKRYGADDRLLNRSGDGSPAQFFNQRRAVHAEQLSGTILVSACAFEGLTNKSVFKLGKQHAQVNPVRWQIDNGWTQGLHVCAQAGR